MSGLQLLLDMGFSKEKADRALAVTGSQDAEAALEWLLAHADELDVAESQAPVLHIPAAAAVSQPPVLPVTDSHSPVFGVPAANQAPFISATNSQTPVFGLSAECQASEAVEPMAVATADQPAIESEIIPSNGEDADSNEAQNEPGHGDPSQNEQAKSLKCDDCGKLFRTEVEVEFHAAKTSHQNFSESTAEIRPLTEDEKKEKLRLLEEKIKERRLQKEAEERREQIAKEKIRRKTGQDVAEAKKRTQDAELMKIAEDRRKEKMEDKLARQRVLDQIASDKAARLAKLANQSGIVTIEPTPPPQPAPTQAAQSKAYAQTKIQIRLPNGTSLTQTFGAKEQLAAVRLYVEINRTDPPGPFTFMTSFPKKVFSEDDMEVPLSELGLVPSAVLIITKI